MKKIVQVNILLSILICLGISTADAQMIPPQSVDPGAINSNNLKDYSDRSKIPLLESVQEKIESETPTISIQSDVGDIEKVKITRVIFAGNTAINSAVLERMTKDLIEKEVTEEEIVNAIQSVSDLYHNKGYLTSFAYIPVDSINDIKNGILEIKVFEGKIGEINITGNRWTRNSYIKNNIFKANNINKKQIFNVNNFNNSLKELNKNDYLRGKVTIQKSEEPESSDIMLDLKERIPLKLAATWDNQGREFIGIQRANISLINNNLTGFGDSISAGVSLAEGTLGVGSNYSIPLGPFGTKYNFGYSFSKVNIGGAYKNLKMVGNSHSFNQSLIQPLYKNNTLNITSDISFDMNHSRTNYLETIKLNGYENRALRLGLNVTNEDKSGTWMFRECVNVGLPLFGATSESTYGLGSSKFVKLDTNLTRVQLLPFKTLGIFRLSGQFSPNTLLSMEQMQLGGANTVRGYDEGLVLGDIGYNASFEIRRAIPFLPDKKWLPLKNRIQLAVFYDQGLAKPIHQEMDAHFLQGVGAGLRINLTKFLTANLDLGIPLGKKITPDQNAVRLHFGLSTNPL